MSKMSQYNVLMTLSIMTLACFALFSLKLLIFILFSRIDFMITNLILLQLQRVMIYYANKLIYKKNIIRNRGAEEMDETYCLLPYKFI